MSTTLITTIDGLRNLRDLGGLRVTGGAVTRTGALFRSEAPCLDGDGVDRLAELGIRSLIDLRDPDEVGEDPVSVPAGAVVIRVPVLRPYDQDGRTVAEQLYAGEIRSFGAEQLGALLIALLEDNARQFGRAVSCIGADAEIPALIHCTAGKDRTGLAVALVLSVIGVSREDILDDFELSTEGRAWRRGAITPALEAIGVDPDAVSGLYQSPRAALDIVLTHLDAVYGSVEAFLAGPAEVDSAAAERLRSALVFPIDRLARR